MVNNGALPIIVLYGATAIGKSTLACTLAQILNAEIISVDSAQIYRTMDIGTAKPKPTIQQAIVHHLIDIVEPHQDYSVAEFIHDCQQAIGHIHQQQKPVILCGGTMLYFHHLFTGLSLLPTSDPLRRQKLHQQWQENPQKTYQKLKEIDPVMATKLHPNDSQRVIRALEIGLHHQPLSRLQQNNRSTPILQPHLIISLTVNERLALHQKIAQRLDQMIADGFVDEVKKLHQHHKLHRNCQSIRTIGYRQFWQYHDQHVTYQQAYDETLAKTRQLAKRQHTWMKRLSTIPNTHTLEYNDPKLLNKILDLYHAIHLSTAV